MAPIPQDVRWQISDPPVSSRDTSDGVSFTVPTGFDAWSVDGRLLSAADTAEMLAAATAYFDVGDLVSGLRDLGRHITTFGWTATASAAVSRLVAIDDALSS
jgi:hypothetical protein